MKRIKNLLDSNAWVIPEDQREGTCSGRKCSAVPVVLVHYVTWRPGRRRSRASSLRFCSPCAAAFLEEAGRQGIKPSALSGLLEARTALGNEGL